MVGLYLNFLFFVDSEKWCLDSVSRMTITSPWASYQIRKVVGCAFAGMPVTFSPPPRVSDPDMHHGTFVTDVLWCMPGSLTSSFLWSRWRGNRSRHSRCICNPQFYVSQHQNGYLRMIFQVWIWKMILRSSPITDLLSYVSCYNHGLVVHASIVFMYHSMNAWGIVLAIQVWYFFPPAPAVIINKIGYHLINLIHAFVFFSAGA